MEKQLLDPNIRADPNAVALLLTDDFLEFGSSGRSYTKAEILNDLKNEAPADLSLTEFTCERLSPEVALVTYRSHRRSSDGTTTSALRSSLWVQRPAGWQLHFHQGTRTEQPRSSTHPSPGRIDS